MRYIELVEMASKDTGAAGLKDMPMDTKLLARDKKAPCVSSVLSAEEEEDQELRLYIHELTNFLVDEVCKRAETTTIKNSGLQ